MKRNQHSSVFKVFDNFHNYLNDTDPLIIPMILIFLCCPEKAHDNKEFSREISKPCRESRIRTR